MSLTSIPSSFVCSLSYLSSISVSGEQTIDYLQGQLTCNMKQLQEGHALRYCHCDFKGKMWANGLVFTAEEHTQLVCCAEAIAHSIAELKKYAVFSKVTIEQPQGPQFFSGWTGVEAAECLAKHCGKLPHDPLSVVALPNQSGWILNLSAGAYERYLVCSTDNSLVSTNDVSDLLVPEACWQATELMLGIPWITANTQQEYIPQMLNMQCLDAIDFKKGCYMGQEVVARTKYLGKNKRATYLLTSPTSESNSIRINTGDMLEKSVGDNWRRGGTILNAVNVSGRWYLLAVLSNDSVVGERLRLKAHPEEVFEICPLPYPIDN
ncbi:YgfZ/GcvT domain-containing protein [Alteromonas flava]|uniref:CAF17-like 4Fe-4S cluster assembly/insertion protein YgfZ n=1 Tax=Alteromonas flava TaxID=2048003 RepID=UPI000C28E667|nr:hypothetical protein [Alteromonas flava]